MVVDGDVAAVAAAVIAPARERDPIYATRMSLGAKLSLGVGIAAFAGAIAIVATGGERLLAVILVLIGAGAMSGFLKARGEQPKAEDQD